MSLRRIDFRKGLNRRTVLRGVGAALALPWLEGMRPRTARGGDAASGKSPVRLAVLYIPNGVRADTWSPEETGRDYRLSTTLAPLSDLSDELLVLSNLWNQASNAGDGHYVKTSGFLTCTTINKSLGIDLNCNGTSLDQVVARHYGHATPLPSLELGVDPVTTGVDQNVGYTRVYGAHIAWSGPTSPLAKEIDPRLAYERLFRAAQPHREAAKRDLRLLDRVLDDARRLHRQLGAADRRRLDEYLQSVSALEGRLARATDADADAWSPAAAVDPATRPADREPADFAEHVRLMLDIVALAFQTDATRVATFMFGNAVSGRSFSFLDGVSGGHHDISHHQNDAAKLEQYERITRWHVQQYGYLLRRLRDMPEGDATVLENSMIVLGAGLRDGNSHDPRNLPIVVGGRGGGRIAVGQHLRFSPDTPLANLYACLLEACGAPSERFADSTGKLPGVLA